MFKPKIKLTDEWQYIPRGCQADGFPAYYHFDQKTGREYAKLLTGKRKIETETETGSSANTQKQQSQDQPENSTVPKKKSRCTVQTGAGTLGAPQQQQTQAQSETYTLPKKQSRKMNSDTKRREKAETETGSSANTQKQQSQDQPENSTVPKKKSRCTVQTDAGTLGAPQQQQTQAQSETYTLPKKQSRKMNSDTKRREKAETETGSSANTQKQQSQDQPENSTVPKKKSRCTVQTDAGTLGAPQQQQTQAQSETYTLPKKQSRKMNSDTKRREKAETETGSSANTQKQQSQDQPENSTVPKKKSRCTVQTDAGTLGAPQQQQTQAQSETYTLPKKQSRKMNSDTKRREKETTSVKTPHYTRQQRRMESVNPTVSEKRRDKDDSRTTPDKQQRHAQSTKPMDTVASLSCLSSLKRRKNAKQKITPSDRKADNLSNERNSVKNLGMTIETMRNKSKAIDKEKHDKGYLHFENEQTSIINKVKTVYLREIDNQKNETKTDDDTSRKSYRHTVNDRNEHDSAITEIDIGIKSDTTKEEKRKKEKQKKKSNLEDICDKLTSYRLTENTDKTNQHINSETKNETQVEDNSIESDKKPIVKDRNNDKQCLLKKGDNKSKGESLKEDIENCDRERTPCTSERVSGLESERHAHDILKQNESNTQKGKINKSCKLEKSNYTTQTESLKENVEQEYDDTPMNNSGCENDKPIKDKDKHSSVPDANIDKPCELEKNDNESQSDSLKEDVEQENDNTPVNNSGSEDDKPRKDKRMKKTKHKKTDIEQNCDKGSSPHTSERLSGCKIEIQIHDILKTKDLSSSEPDAYIDKPCELENNDNETQSESLKEDVETEYHNTPMSNNGSEIDKPRKDKREKMKKHKKTDIEENCDKERSLHTSERLSGCESEKQIHDTLKNKDNKSSEPDANIDKPFRPEKCDNATEVESLKEDVEQEYDNSPMNISRSKNEKPKKDKRKKQKKHMKTDIEENCDKERSLHTSERLSGCESEIQIHDTLKNKDNKSSEPDANIDKPCELEKNDKEKQSESLKKDLEQEYDNTPMNNSGNEDDKPRKDKRKKKKKHKKTDIQDNCDEENSQRTSERLSGCESEIQVHDTLKNKDNKSSVHDGEINKPCELDKNDNKSQSESLKEDIDQEYDNTPMNYSGSDYEKPRRDKRNKKKKHKKIEDEIDCVSDIGMESDDTRFSDEDRYTFMFTLSEEEWDLIKPTSKVIGSKNRKLRRLGQEWTGIFYRHISQQNKGCTLSARKHRVSSERRHKGTSFVFASAVCTGRKCKTVYTFNIMEEGDRNVYCRWDRPIRHEPSGEEINRRHISGIARSKMANRVIQTNASQVFDDNLINAVNSDKEKLSHDDYTDTPNLQVLRKLVSELYQKEYTHANIMYELQLLKETDELLNVPYIRDIGLDPFMVILFSNEQLQLMKTLSSANSLDIYLDATGKVINNIQRQKRPFLFSMVVRLEHANLPVSIADMISTDHTIPRISLFFSSIKRAVTLKGHTLRIRKIETDFSWALMQASLNVTNLMSIKTYLKKCFEILSNNEKVDITILHICISHMLQNFIRTLNSKIPKKLDKEKRRFILKCFASLQNCTSLNQTKELFKNMCSVFLSKYEPPTETSQFINQISHFQVKELDSESESEGEEFDGDGTTSNNAYRLEDMTIRQASPFSTIFDRIRQGVEEDVKDDNGETNNLYQPEVIDILQRSYMPLLPLWTGLMLSRIYDDGTTRDSNSAVENWFRHVKNDIIVTLRDRRPSVFTTKLKAATQARILLNEFPSAKLKKTNTGKKKRKLNETNLDCSEEIWSKAKKPRKNLYHKTGNPKRNNTKTGDDKAPDKPLPDVMEWGGNLDGEILTNTCTIDNVLTMLHLFYKENIAFQNCVNLEDGHTYNTLKHVINLMEEGSYDLAKVSWIDSQPEITGRRNLYGDEVDFIIRVLDNELLSRTVSKCDDNECAKRIIEIDDIHGLNTLCTLSISNPAENVQEVVDKWLWNEDRCVIARRKQGQVCGGTRTVKRRVIKSSPVLIVRVFEHFQNSSLSISQILNSIEVTLSGKTYAIAGITMYRVGHYCSIVRFDEQYYWYDGLKARLSRFPERFSEVWIPVNAVYCQI